MSTKLQRFGTSYVQNLNVPNTQCSKATNTFIFISRNSIGDFGIFMCIGSVIYMAYFGCQKVLEDGFQPVVLVNTSDANLLLWLGSCAYIFEGINMVLPIYESAEDKESMPTILLVCTTTITFLYAFFGSTPTLKGSALRADSQINRHIDEHRHD